MSEISATRRLLQSQVTGQWLGTEGQWTTDIDQARDFHSIVEAMGAVEHHALVRVQFVIRFGYALQSDFVVDLPDNRAKRKGWATGS